MLKRRIIPVQLLIGGRLVKTVKFDSYRDVGDPVASSKVYSSQDADELVFLNIERGPRSIEPLLSCIKKVSAACFMPLSLGGGIATEADVEALIRNGADKVVVNSICYRSPGTITRSASRFGSQAMVVSIDARRDPESGEIRLYSDCGRKLEPVSLEDHIKTMISAGAGEIFVNSIDRDGAMQGYDIDLIKRAKAASSVPVIGCGGAGHYEHLRDGFLETNAEALACGSLFNFGDNNPLRAKAFLTNYGLKFKVI